MGSTTVEIRSPRLLLRCWRSTDLTPFAELNADPVVMEHFPAPLSRDESDALADRISDGLESRGWGLWAVEVTDAERPASFIGFVGLSTADFDAHFTPAIEIGWRLNRRHWGQGYATEAARAVVTWARGNLGTEEIVSFTTTTNGPSQAVMRRLGMSHDPGEDFDHPRVDPQSRLCRHVLYRLRLKDWDRPGG